MFDDREALFAVAAQKGLEGVAAKRQEQRYRPSERGWIKTKNRSLGSRGGTAFRSRRQGVRSRGACTFALTLAVASAKKSMNTPMTGRVKVRLTADTGERNGGP